MAITALVDKADHFMLFMSNIGLVKKWQTASYSVLPDVLIIYLLAHLNSLD